MVLSHNLRDIIQASCNSTTALSLPAFKDNPLEIDFTRPDVITTVYKLQKPVLPFASSDTLEAEISDWVCLTAKDNACKAVYEVSLTNAGNNFVYRPGDTIGIIPHNNKAEVDAIIEHLNLSSISDLQYTLNLSTSQKGGKIPPHIPIKSSIRHVLNYCCDIRSVLKKLFLLELSRHTKDDGERKILEYLCSKEGSMAYNTHVLNRQFCLLDLLSTFKSCNPPIKVLLAHLPRLLPRPYSIVNSRHTNPNIIKICFSVMDSGNRKGLVTGWLENLITEGKYSIEEKMQSLNLNNELKRVKVHFYLRKNVTSFSPPDNLETPMILIGPGTGISPFIGFLEERRHLKCSSEVKAGDVWVFFGCRNPSLDFIYEKELKSFLNDGTISKLSTSFSRIENSENKYIQDALLLNGEALVKLVNEGASIFVCGDLKNMALQVKDTIISCFVKYDKKSQHEAESFISVMQTEKRYLVDV